MSAFQAALGLAARGGRAFERDGVMAAIVPGLPDLALANAAVYRDAAGLGTALPLLERAYVENVTLRPGIPVHVVPALLPTARPVHRVVQVDVFLPGCPPSADLIYRMLVDLIEGRAPDTNGARFGR